MPRTILQIAQEAAERAILPAPSVLFGSNDRISRILRVAAIDTMREIMDAADRNGLSDFASTWVFELEPDKFLYDLPPDYQGVIPGTEHRNNWPVGLLGPVGPIGWSNWLNNVTVPTTPYGWRIRGNKLAIEPIPTARELIQIDYKSRYAVKVALSDMLAANKIGDNFPRLPFIPMEGHIKYASSSAWGSGEWGVAKWGDFDPASGGTLQDFMTGLRRELADGSLGWTTQTGPYARKEFFDADTDLPAFDDDHVLSLGMTWRLEKGMSKDYADNMDRYYRRLQVQLADDAGGGRDISLEKSRGTLEQVPLDNNGNWVVS